MNNLNLTRDGRQRGRADFNARCWASMEELA
ncbi:hypothetical protein ACSSVQ_000347 [Parvibaculum sp. MBR-TMA-1.3b-4.2]|jgi:hypothetical protein